MIESRAEDERRIIKVAQLGDHYVRIHDIATTIGRSVRYVHSIVNESERMGVIVGHGCNGMYGTIRRVRDYEIEVY